MHNPAIPVQITFRHVDPSAAVESHIRELVQKLGKVHPALQSCSVTVAQQHRHRPQGNPFHVGISVKLPGHELVANRESADQLAHTDVYVALRDAFNAMRRQLQALADQQQNQVKPHAPQPHGHITEIARDKTCGRIESVDGRWLYFQRNSLIGAELDALAIGTPVCYVEEMGRDGPQASSIYPVGKHHILV